MLDWLRRKIAPAASERRAVGFTAEVMALREAHIAGARGLAEVTATAQSCVSLWEGGLMAADVSGTYLLDRRSMALCARSLALRGEALFLIRETGLVPVADYDLSTRDGEPRAYRLSVPDVGGGRTQTALAAEVLHIRLAADPVAPWIGQAPLRRAKLTAAMLHAVESALGEVYETAPLGSQVVPFPEAQGTDLDALGRSFRGRRGRVLLRESVHVQAAGGPAPSQDWRPADLTPDLSKSLAAETWAAARDAICAAFGVLPGLLNPATTGPMVREAQRHLACWTLQPVAMLIAEEASAKLGTAVAIDTLRPLQAFDAGGRARALATIVEAIARAKEAGLEPQDVAGAFRLVDWEGGRG